MPPPQVGAVDWAAEADKIRQGTPTGAPAATSPPPAAPSAAGAQPDWGAVADAVRTGSVTNFQTDPSKLLAKPPPSSGRPLITDKALWSGLGNIAEMGASVVAPELFGPTRAVPIITRIVGRMVAAGGAGTAAHTMIEGAHHQLDAGAPQTLRNLASDIPPTFAQYASGEGLAGAFTGVKDLAKAGAQRLLRAPMSPTGAEASQMLDGHITPAQGSDRWGTALVENALKRGMFTGGKWVDYFKQQGTLLSQKADEILAGFGGRTTADEVGGAYVKAQQGAAAQAEAQAGATRRALTGPPSAPVTPETAGQTWLKLQQAAEDARTATGNALYADVWPLAEQEGVRVSLDPLKEYAAQSIQQRGDPAMDLLRGPVKKAFSAVQEATSASTPEGTAATAHLQQQAEGGASPEFVDQLRATYARAGIREVDQQAGTLSLQQAKELRTQIGYNLQNDPTSDFKKMYGLLSEAIKGATTDASGQLTPAGRAFKEATDHWSALKHDFEDSLLGQVAQKEPRLVVETLVQPNRVEELKHALEVVGPEGQQAIAHAHMRELLIGPTGKPATTTQLQRRIRELSWDTIHTLHGNQVQPLLEELGAHQDVAASLTPKSWATPQEAFASLIKPGAVDEVTKAKGLLSPVDWQKVQSAKAQQVLFNPDGTLRAGKDIAAATFDPAFKAAYPAGEGDGLAQFGRVVKYLQRPQPNGAALLWTQRGLLLAVPAAVTAAATGHMTTQHAEQVAGAVTGMVLSPRLLTMVLLNPAARQWLTEGITAQAAGNPGLASRLAGQVSAWVGREVYHAATQQPPAAPSTMRGVPPVGPTTGAGGGPLGRGVSATAPPPLPPS